MSDVLLAGPLDWRDATALFAQIAQAVAHLHAHGFAHRDIRPENVRVGDDGTARLVGFSCTMDATSLARMAHEAPLGDLSYVAPEVIADPNHHGPRADLYALGCTLYEALSGRAAFPAATWAEQAEPQVRMLEWKTRADALDPGEEVAPPWLCNLVRKATHPDPDKRLPDIESFIGWLEAARAAWERPARLTPAPVPRTAAPPALPPMAPTLSRPPAPAWVPPPAPPGPPPMLLFGVAAVLGMVTALAFSTLLILFVEMRLA